MVRAKSLASDPLVRAIDQTIRRCGLLRPGESVVVAVSGGPDSVALLQVLSALAPDLDLRLTVAHLDHGLRAESGEEAAYVRRLARRLGVPVVVERADVAALAREAGRSLEEAARLARYRFLGRLATRIGASVVTAGHQRDDQAETVLLHLVRGSGLAGLAGMAHRGPYPDPEYAGLVLVRPLLDRTRAEITAFCRRHRLQPQQDSTNEQIHFTRNRIRHNVLPALAEINPRAGEALARLAEAARFDHEYLDTVAGEVYQQTVRSDGSGLTFDRQKVHALAPALRRRVLQQAAATGGCSLTARQIEVIEHCLAGTEPCRVDLAADIALSCAGRRCVFGRPSRPQTSPPDVSLPRPGTAFWGDWRIDSQLVDPAMVARDADPWRAVVDAERLPAHLIVRARRPGDRLHLGGAAGTKRLQDYFVDRRVPLDERDQLPLVLAGDHLVWIAGHRIDACFRPTAATRHLVELTARQAGDG